MTTPTDHAERDEKATEYANLHRGTRDFDVHRYGFMNGWDAALRSKVVAKMAEAAYAFARIEADNGDDFEGVHEDVILRVEVTAGDLHRVREALTAYRAAVGEGEK